jgi:hypothetical protein
MNNNHYTYNQPPMGQMMPPPQMGMPPQMGAPHPRGWRERWMRRFGMDMSRPMQKGELTIPNWFNGKSIVFFFVAMLACWGVFGHVPTFDLVLVTSLSVLLFFYGGYTISNSYAHSNSKKFVRNVFWIGVAVRFVWILYMYFVFNPTHYGNTFGDTADVDWYMPFGEAISKWIKGEGTGTFGDVIETWGSAIDDVGYPFWLGIIYMLTGNASDVFIPFVLKCIVSSYCAVSIYNIAKRHYGEGTARIASLFVALNPNMIYWCASMMKETEMVFLTCLAIDNFDKVLTSGKKFTIKNLLPSLLAAMALMFFRSVLSIVVFLAFFAHIVMASQRVMSIGKKIIAGILVAAVLAVSMGDRIRTQSHDLMEKVQSDSQKENMEWRAQRENGNTYAKYAGAAVFAPLIFTIPFPTMNQVLDSQTIQNLQSGGYYIKNILSFFVIIVMIMMLISGEWRRHVFILAYTIGYHLVLVMSSFAHSGRFHMPVIPMLMLFAAYGVQIAKTNGKVRRWYPIALVLEVVVCLAWGWFKLAGRGMI